MNSELIAVFDVGKTHARLVLVEALSGKVLFERRRTCAPVRKHAYLELDLEGTGTWLIEALASAPHRERIRHFVPIAHGAAAVLIDSAGQPLAALDYEEPSIEAVSETYDPLRDAFAETYSPCLPLGLNLGRQWYFLQSQHPALWKRIQTALLHPQYWAWRLSGIAACEITSLGCHTDLWRPSPSASSALALRQGWDRLLPPLRAAGEVLGLINPAIASAAGISAQCRIYCGIHDSNASYLCHLAAHGAWDTGTCRRAPFSVISSGTWTVVMAQGTPLSRLQERLDMLANMDALGRPVATARFMGGREYAHLAGPASHEAMPDLEALVRLLEQGVLALPSFAPQGGPFAGHVGTVEHGAGVDSPAMRATLATLYSALMSDLLLDHLGATGRVIVDGPLARNPLFASILSTLRPGSQVHANHALAGAPAAARYLVTAVAPALESEASRPLHSEAQALARHRQQWRLRIAERLAH